MSSKSKFNRRRPEDNHKSSHGRIGSQHWINWRNFTQQTQHDETFMSMGSPSESWAAEFFHDNLSRWCTCPQKCCDKATCQHGFEILPHPVFSPDIAPCDFHLCPQIKKMIKGHYTDSKRLLNSSKRSKLRSPQNRPNFFGKLSLNGAIVPKNVLNIKVTI